MGRSNGSSKWAAVVALAFCAALIMMLPQVSGKRFIVGGSMGWTSNVNYTLWTAYQTFYLGDWLFFVYDVNKDDVLEVKKTNYETCSAKHPINNYTIGVGRDVVSLNVTHDRYFISKRSCYGGMKLHVQLTPFAPPPHLIPLAPPSHLTPLPSLVHVTPSPSPIHLTHSSSPSPSPSPSPIHLIPLPQSPRAAPSKSHSSIFIVLGSQLVIPIIVTIMAIRDSLLL